MNCPKCGGPVASRKGICEHCGCDLAVYRRIIRISNGYYNVGLEKAKVRDLSGAVLYLKRSLEVNKKNTSARNLLGLVYYEMGETVAALSQWVISKNFAPDDEVADRFIAQVQDDPTELDTINQSVRKYNLALEAAKQGNHDTAIIQLKKAVSLYGRFLKALQLLAVLYIEAGEYERARRLLNRARQIDVNNTTTLRYLREIDRITDPEGQREYDDRWDERESRNKGPVKGVTAVGNYKEDKPNIMAFVNLLIGVIIGITVVYYLIVPTVKSNLREEYESSRVDFSADISNKNATIGQQEKTIESLRKQVDALQNELENIEPERIEVQVAAPIYDEFFTVQAAYNELVGREYSDDELQDVALQLWAVNTEAITNGDARRMLQEMRDHLYPLAARTIYKSGRAMFDAGDYTGAAGMLKAAVDLNPESDTAMYYLGKSYQALEQFEDAIRYYRLMLEVCPNSTLKDYIPLRLRECGDGT